MGYLNKSKYIAGVVFVLCAIALQSAATPPVQSKTRPHLTFRIGHSWEGVVTLYTKPDDQKKYHVLSEHGDTLFIGKIVERREGTCGGEPDHSVWGLEPKTSISGLESKISPLSIVVESDSTVPFKAVPVEPIKLKEVEMKNYFAHLSLPAEIREGWKKRKLKYYVESAGRANNGIKRIILFAFASLDSDPDFFDVYPVVSIAEMNHENLKEVHTIYPDWWLGNVTGGMADTNGDGLADVYLLYEHSELSSAADRLLIEQGSKWTLQRSYKSESC